MSLNWKSPVNGGCCDDCSAGICDEKPVITSASSYSHAGCGVSYAITASHSPTSYSATGLPSGLSCNSSTGVISGSVAAPFTGTVTVKATNACGTGSKAVSFTLSAPVAAPTITSSSTASGTGCLAFSYSITATDSPTSYGASGLPSGLSVNTGTGEITGRVRSAWSGTVTVSATNACGTGTLDVSVTIDAPSVPSPTLVCDTIAASISKCGYAEWTSPSTPPKYYLRRDLTGHVAEDVYSGVTCGSGTLTQTDQWYSGSCVFDPVTCMPGTSTLANSLTGGYAYGDPSQAGCEAVECVPSVTQTTITTTGDSNCYSSYPAHVWYGSYTDTLSVEYTTATLLTSTVSALPSYPNTWVGANEAMRDLSADELTYSIQRFKYKFILPDLTGFDCYKIEWNEGSTAKSYIWNGTDTETGVYGEVTEPGTDGSITVNSIVVTCACS